MKNIFGFALIALLFSNCKPVKKVELPFIESPPTISYSKTINSTAERNINYDNVMRRFTELNSETKIVNDDKYNSYFQIIGYSVCTYKNHDRKISYLLTFQGEKNEFNILLSHIKIRGVRLESYYVKNNRTTKKLNPTYEEINTKILTLLDELTKQIK